MLSTEETKEILMEIEQQEFHRAACVEALKIMQRYRGRVSDEGIRELALLLRMTPAELDAVATFYPFIFRKPVGRHVVYLCDSVSCWIMGYEGLRDHLINRMGIGMGETTPDGRFTLLPVSCIGACDHAPALMIDRDLHGELTPEKLDIILDQYT